MRTHPSQPFALNIFPQLSRVARRCAAASLVLLAPVIAYTQETAAAPPYPRPVPRYEVDVDTGIMVPMRDGVRMATDIYRPRGLSGALPAVLMRGPYDKSGDRGAIGTARFFAGQGYAVALQDVRGKWASEGHYRVYEGDTTDWTDTFTWIAGQPWSTGKIGTIGCSYLGEGQITAAQQRHPSHIAAIPQAAGGNLGRFPGRRSFWGSVEGGASALSINFGWMTMYASIDKGARPLPKLDFAEFFRTLPVIDMADRAGSPSWDWRNFLERSPDDPWWDAQGYLSPDDSVAIAALHVTSWFDLAGEALQQAGLFARHGTTPRARTGQYMIVSPTVHCASETATSATSVGALVVGDARLHYWDIYLKWFDFWLKDAPNGVLSMPHVQYYVIGRDEWRGSEVWPLSTMRPTSYYLHSGGRANSSAGDGRLTTRAPGREVPDTFTYDPDRPIPARGGSICCTGNPKDQPGSYDNADLEQRPDMLVYSTDITGEGLELTGPMSAEVYVSSDVKDTDITVKLLDVFPDGRSMNMVEGIKRVRYRNGFGTPVFMQRDKVYKVPVDLHATSWFLPAGHKLRVEISSSNFPRFERNLNTGGRNYDETTWVVAHNAVHHSLAHASRLVLPVVRGGGGRRAAGGKRRAAGGG